ncbi:MAG: T9SS type A sorting domain-containing protein [Ignavibacteria bacterium]|nr:T9SS type A sorting domain-containing protein [Ignavibacteria bacterium]
MWIHTEGFILSVNNSGSEITGYTLSQNYPNPFNPSTTIEFSLSEDKFVSLEVFDATGKEILTLVNNFLLSGKYSFDFNGNDLESGIYFYNLTAGNFNSAGKMILMK